MNETVQPPNINLALKSKLLISLLTGHIPVLDPWLEGNTVFVGVWYKRLPRPQTWTIHTIPKSSVLVSWLCAYPAVHEDRTNEAEPSVVFTTTLNVVEGRLYKLIIFSDFKIITFLPALVSKPVTLLSGIKGLVLSKLQDFNDLPREDDKFWSYSGNNEFFYKVSCAWDIKTVPRLPPETELCTFIFRDHILVHWVTENLLL